MTEWRWLRADVLFAIHDRQLAEHGGLPGVINAGSIEAALARPQHLAAYESPGAAALAAAYAFGLVRNHGFADGNKRIGWIAARLFLAENGYKLSFDPVEAVSLMESIAAGKFGEAKIAEWFRQRITDQV
jgi:death-on-curing protein